MTNFNFDPGYGQHITSFVFSLENIYQNVNRFKNINQRKFYFKQYYTVILDLIKQNTEFYLGCLLWAVYLRNQPECKIDKNYCLGKTYDEESSLIELNFLMKFVADFSKDTKYYLSKDFSYPEENMEMLKVYKEFACMNQGFVNVEKNTDLKFPEKLKNPTEGELIQVKSTIDEVVASGDFDKLNNVKGFIL